MKTALVLIVAFVVGVAVLILLAGIVAGPPHHIPLHVMYAPVAMMGAAAVILAGIHPAEAKDIAVCMMLAPVFFIVFGSVENWRTNFKGSWINLVLLLAIITVTCGGAWVGRWLAGTSSGR